MTKYAFYVTTSQIRGEWRGNTYTVVEIYRQTNPIRKTRVPTGIDTAHIIVLGFIKRRIQLELLIVKVTYQS